MIFYLSAFRIVKDIKKKISILTEILKHLEINNYY